MRQIAATAWATAAPAVQWRVCDYYDKLIMCSEEMSGGVAGAPRHSEVHFISHG